MMTPALALALALALAAEAPPGVRAPPEKEKLSYATGVSVARNLRRQGVELDVETFHRAFRDAYYGRKLSMTDEELARIMAAELGALRRQTKYGRTMAGAAEREGEAALAANRTQPGVVALPSGLQYKVLAPAEGRRPGPGDTVECRYRGALLDGTVVEETARADFGPRAGGKPATFRVADALPGLREALQLMSVGSRWQVWVPAELAYGRRGSGRSIPPGAALVYDLELIAIQ